MHQSHPKEHRGDQGQESHQAWERVVQYMVGEPLDCEFGNESGNGPDEDGTSESGAVSEC
jgi:hypothetical protein